MDWPAKYGLLVMSVFTIDTSAEAAAVPLLPVLSVLLLVFGSFSAGVAVALLSNAPAALIVAVTVIDVLAPLARLATVQGNAAHAPLTLVIVRLVGVSATWMFVAVDGPALAMRSEYVMLWPALNRSEE